MTQSSWTHRSSFINQPHLNFGITVHSDLDIISFQVHDGMVVTMEIRTWHISTTSKAELAKGIIQALNVIYAGRAENVLTVDVIGDRLSLVLSDSEGAYSMTSTREKHYRNPNLTYLEARFQTWLTKIVHQHPNLETTEHHDWPLEDVEVTTSAPTKPKIDPSVLYADNPGFGAF